MCLQVYNREQELQLSQSHNLCNTAQSFTQIMDYIINEWNTFLYHICNQGQKQNFCYM